MLSARSRKLLKLGKIAEIFFCVFDKLRFRSGEVRKRGRIISERREIAQRRQKKRREESKQERLSKGSVALEGGRRRGHFLRRSFPTDHSFCDLPIYLLGFIIRWEVGNLADTIYDIMARVNALIFESPYGRGPNKEKRIPITKPNQKYYV